MAGEESVEDPAEDSESETLKSVLATWIAASERPETTHRAYTIAFDHLERLGITTLADVSRASIREFLRRRTEIERRRPVTVNRELAALCSILGYLEQRDLFPTGLLMELRRLRFKVRKRRLRRAPFYMPARVHELAASAREVAPRVELPILVDAYSGLRVGELARLHTSDLTLSEKPMLHVRSKPELGPIGRIKNGHERAIPMCSYLKELFQKRVGEEGWVFPAEDEGFGRPPSTPWMSPQSLRRHLKFARMHARLPDATFVLLRHSRASWWAAAGVARLKLCEWIGDTLQVVEQFYLGLEDGYDPDCELMPV